MKVPFVTFKPLEKELDKDLRDAFERVYNRSWYIEGVEDEAFEKAFAEYCDSKFCVGVGNGLDSLFLALKAMGIKEGDEVIVPSNTYIATALAVTYTGATPIFVEPDIRTFNIDPTKIEAAITDKTRAIMLYIYMDKLAIWIQLWKSQRNIIFMLLKIVHKHMGRSIKER